MTYFKKRQMIGWLFIAPYLIAFLTFIAVPIGVSLWLSTMQYDMTAPEKVHFVGGQNYADAWKDDYFWQALVATGRFVILMVPSMVVTALTLALGLNAMSKGLNVVRAVLFLPGMLNVAVAGILWQWFYNNEFGLFNFALKNMHQAPIPFLSDREFAMPSIVAMSLWWSVGGTSVIVLAALQQIPAQIFEAATIDGAGFGPLLSKMTLPLLKPVLLFVIITNTIGAFQVFGQPFMLTRGGPELTTRGVVQYIYETAFNNYRMGYGAAMSWMLFAIIALFGLVQYRVMRRNAA